jgi:H+/Cl- antiporter ClcA
MKTGVLGGALRVLGLSHERLRQSTQVYMVLVSIAVGLLGGLGAVVFREFIRLGQFVFWRSGEYSLQYIHELPWWWKLAAPATGGLIVGLIIYYFASEAKGHGVPEVMESIVLRGGRIRPRVVLAKLVASGVCIASGGSVGREGPIVQIGSAIGSTVGQWASVNVVCGLSSRAAPQPGLPAPSTPRWRAPCLRSRSSSGISASRSFRPSSSRRWQRLW